MEQPNERMAAIGRMIATMRQARSMTQQQFAQTIGLTQDRVSEIENGKVNITLATLFKICDALNCYCDMNFTPK